MCKPLSYMSMAELVSHRSELNKRVKHLNCQGDELSLSRYYAARDKLNAVRWEISERTPITRARRSNS